MQTDVKHIGLRTRRPDRPRARTSKNHDLVYVALLGNMFEADRGSLPIEGRRQNWEVQPWTSAPAP
jgi:hypothetical protein